MAIPAVVGNHGAALGHVRLDCKAGRQQSGAHYKPSAPEFDVSAQSLGDI